MAGTAGASSGAGRPSEDGPFDSQSRRCRRSNGQPDQSIASSRACRSSPDVSDNSDARPGCSLRGIGGAQNIEVVGRLLAALRSRDEARVAAELHPEVEAVGARGHKHGIEEVVAWAKPSVDGHLVSSVEVDEVREVTGEWVAVAARRLWSWTETGDVADEQGFGVLFRIRDSKVVSWNQTYDSLADAIDAIPA